MSERTRDQIEAAADRVLWEADPDFAASLGIRPPPPIATGQLRASASGEWEGVVYVLRLPPEQPTSDGGETSE